VNWADAWTGALRQNTLETLFEESPDFVFVLDAEGKFLAGNRALAERTGHPWDELRLMPSMPIVHPDDREHVAAEFAAALAGETRRYHGRGTRPDGTVFHVDVVNVPVRVDGKVVAVLGIAHDIDLLADIRDSLDRSRGLMRIASRVARFGGWQFDVATRERYWSAEVFEMLGHPGTRPPDAAVVLAQLDDEDRARVGRALDRCISDGLPIDFTARFALPAGGFMHARVVGEAVRDANGVVVLVEGALSDITAEVEARQAHRLVETRLTAAFDSMTDVFAFVDTDWTVTYVNSSAISMLGRGAANLVGNALWDLALEDAEGESMLREVMRERHPLVRRRFDEELGRWMEVTGFPAGDLLGIHVRDVTELEEARRRIVDDSRRIHAQSMLLDHASEAIVMRGLGGSIEYANEATASLLGTGDAPLTGRSLSEVLALGDDTVRELEAALASAGRWHGEMVLRRPDGTERFIETRWQIVDDPDGNPDAVFCHLIDVTDRRRQDEILLRTQRMESIGTLAGGIAHDLNNVLTPLLLSTQLLANDLDVPTRTRILAGMQQTIERGADMIRQVLTFARGVEGERTVVDIGELTERFAKFCGDILPKSIAVDASAAPDLAVLGDSTQLMQVLMNLATNARDAMPDGGHLRLTATGDDARVVIEVADDGTGMSADALDRIFEPFFTTKGIGRGTGLGLSVSQAIARTHGGSLEASSAVGSGTTFRLELPRSLDDASEEADPLPGAAADLTGLRVLVVDDEDEIVELASLVIAAAGGVPVGARDAVEGHAALAGAAFDVVVTDLVMPGTTGRAFLEAIAQSHPDLPAVAMSGIPEQGDRASRRDNVRAILDKPFTAEELLAAIVLATADRSP
jgi:two-component system, cell cycle sensor histidine kinase and response regulator CckA